MCSSSFTARRWNGFFGRPKSERFFNLNENSFRYNISYLLLTKVRGVRIFHEFVNYLMPIRTFSFSSLKNLILLSTHHLFIRRFFFPFLFHSPITPSCNFLSGTGNIIKVYPKFSSKNISQYCNTPSSSCTPAVYYQNMPFTHAGRYYMWLYIRVTILPIQHVYTKVTDAVFVFYTDWDSRKKNIFSRDEFVYHQHRRNTIIADGLKKKFVIFKATPVYRADLLISKSRVQTG